jgi:hypothetical protein
MLLTKLDQQLSVELLRREDGDPYRGDGTKGRGPAATLHHGALAEDRPGAQLRNELPVDLDGQDPVQKEEDVYPDLAMG